MVFWQFSRNNTYVSIPGKLSEVHLYAWLFSNPCGKVLITVGISWSPDLRVQRIYRDRKLLINALSAEKLGQCKVTGWQKDGFCYGLELAHQEFVFNRNQTAKLLMHFYIHDSQRFGAHLNNVITSWKIKGVEYHSWIGFIKTLTNLGNCEQKTMAPQIFTYNPESNYPTEKECWKYLAWLKVSQK